METAASRSTAIEVPSPIALAERDRAELARRLGQLGQLGLERGLTLGQQPVGVLVHPASVGPWGWSGREERPASVAACSPRTAPSPRPVAPDVVYAFLSDFENAEEWDPGTVECQRVDGDGGVGTRYRNVSSFLGRTTTVEYVARELNPPTFVHFEGHNEQFTGHDRISLQASGGGTQVTYDAEFDLPRRQQDRRPARGGVPPVPGQQDRHPPARAARSSWHRRLGRPRRHRFRGTIAGLGSTQRRQDRGRAAGRSRRTARSPT